nr:unnamed protein product [Digitaria exilis]
MGMTSDSSTATSVEANQELTGAARTSAGGGVQLVCEKKRMTGGGVQLGAWGGEQNWGLGVASRSAPVAGE